MNITIENKYLKIEAEFKHPDVTVDDAIYVIRGMMCALCYPKDNIYEQFKTVEEIDSVDD